MAKRLVTLIIAVSLLVGSAGAAAAVEHDFETRGFYDYPPRWVIYPIHALGWVLGTFIAKPLTYAACGPATITGCTTHERRSLGMDKVDIDLTTEAGND